MLAKPAGILFSVLLCACVAVHPTPVAKMQQAPSQPRLYIGHGTRGEVVVAASHYDAMNGLAVEASDLGLASFREGGQVFCLREVPTGTHLARWICRYQDAIERNRALTQNDMAEARINLTSPSASMVVVGVGGGGGGARGSPLPR